MIWFDSRIIDLGIGHVLFFSLRVVSRLPNAKTHSVRLKAALQGRTVSGLYVSAEK